MTPEERREYMKDYYHAKKEKYIDLLGGQCAKCGATESLSFDHIDPSTKEFNIGHLLNHSEKKILKELKKCQLLCFNCHEKKTKDNLDTFTINRAMGEDTNSNVLTEEEVLEIRAKIKKGIGMPKLAKEYGVHYGTIYAIKVGKTWAHLL